jgi:hypothetical protein
MIEEIIGFLMGAWDAIVRAFENVIRVIDEVFTSVANFFVNILGEIWEQTRIGEAIVYLFRPRQALINADDEARKDINNILEKMAKGAKTVGIDDNFVIPLDANNHVITDKIKVIDISKSKPFEVLNDHVKTSNGLVKLVNTKN